MYEKKVKVVLHGHLKKLYPHDIELTGYSVAEIVKGLSFQIKELKPEIGKDMHTVSILGYDTEEALTGPINPKDTEIHIVPVMQGSKGGGGLIRIVIGVVIIAVAVATAGSGGLFMGTAFAMSTGSLIMSGAMLILGGLLEVMSPAPKMDSKGNSSAGTDPEASNYLGASQNTVKIGTRIPLAYGKVKLFGHYISFDIDAKDVAL